jgi:hypothetical protein
MALTIDRTYTLYYLDRPIEQFDSYTQAILTLTRRITGEANHLKGYGYSREERLAEARKVWSLKSERDDEPDFQ